MKLFPRILLFAAVMFVSMLPVITHASADPPLEVETYVIDLQPVAGDLFTIASAGLAAIGAWLLGGILVLLRQRYKLEVDDKVRAYLDEALYTAITWALAKAKDRVADIKNPHVKNQMLADAANYALARVPDAIKHFKITPEGLKEMIEARLPDVFEIKAALPDAAPSGSQEGGA